MTSQVTNRNIKINWISTKREHVSIIMDYLKYHNAFKSPLNKSLAYKSPNIPGAKDIIIDTNYSYNKIINGNITI